MMLRSLLGMIKKEFLQVSRDANLLRIIFFMPLIQLLVLGYAINTEVKLIDLDVYDFDRTTLSREFTNSMKAGDYFVLHDGDESLFMLSERYESGEREVSLVIPNDFSERLQTGREVTLSLIADGSNANSAAVGLGYAAQIAREFSQEVTGFKPPIEVRSRVLYNPEMESTHFMIPGIIATLLTMITVVITSMAIVRERETGTLEQLLVTPISGPVLLLGKLIPFAIMGLVEMVLAVAFGVAWFGIPFVGSALLLLLLSLLYLLTTLGIGLFFSTVTSTQQQAMFFAWFFAVFAILTSGFFTPIANMPTWVQYVTYVNPMRYFVTIVRGILMKASGVADLQMEILALVIFGAVIFTISALRFHKRTA
jgi:ABC-2 type transport system permease protein